MQYEGFLIDLDGTMYRGNERIKGAKEFIDYLNKKKYPYLFITNNSTLTKEAVVEKLAHFDIKTTENNVLTSAIATANYIKNLNQEARCFVIGETGLQQAIQAAGLQMTDYQSDYVVVGLDREITYEKIAKANLLIRDGATFISTNKDAAIPTEKGLLPGNGALTAAIAVSSGVDPLFVGKPDKIIMEEALKLLALSRENVLMIGDNYQTDILAGIHAQVDTLMVLTGFSTRENVLEVARKPTYIKENLLEWMQVKS